MYELTYKSKARPEITAQEVQDILNTAESENAKRYISGCLLFHKSTFIQILEGPEHNVLELYNKIKSDIRHSEIELLWEGRCSERIFLDWKMAFHSPNCDTSPSEIYEFEKNLLMFSKFCDKPTAAVRLFWSSVSKLLAQPRNKTSKLRVN